jgi:dTDP-4-dehydrorhamnose reductase
MNGNKVRILVLGASGMLGRAMVCYFSGHNDFEVFGSYRSRIPGVDYFKCINAKIMFGHNLENPDHLIDVFKIAKPEIVINCVGLVKQQKSSKDPIFALPINSILPHRLARLSSLVGARFLHISTDCVFSGRQGMYKESDEPDALDVYGRSKLLGEVDYDNALTLRTSIIGHEVNTNHSLLNWFLSQEGVINGYTKALFSGLPAVELARLIHDYVIPNTKLRGLYHVSSDPISKYELLKLISTTYDKEIIINPDDSVVIDRTLDSTLFKDITGASIDSWPKLVQAMFLAEQKIVGNLC